MGVAGGGREGRGGDPVGSSLREAPGGSRGALQTRDRTTDWEEWDRGPWGLLSLAPYRVGLNLTLGPHHPQADQLGTSAPKMAPRVAVGRRPQVLGTWACPHGA